MLHDDSIFAGERHHVRHGTDSHQLQEGFQYALKLFRRPTQRAEQALHELERHPHAAEIFFRITAIRPVGVEHGERGRQLGFRQVVVGDDDVDRKLARTANHFGRPNARIHADDERHAAPGSRFHHLGPHPVAVLEPIRYVEISRPPGELDGALENHHRCRPVHVVIAIDQDFFAIADGAAKTIECEIHAAQRERVMKILEGRMKITFGAGGIPETAAV